MPTSEAEGKPLMRENAETPGGALALGVLASRSIKKDGVACFVVAKDGTVEMVSLAELYADMMPEADAILALGGKGYTDEKLGEYLKGRDHRKKVS